MENYQKLLFIFALTFMLSCDFGKNNSPNQSTTGRTVLENKELTNTNNYNKTGNFNELDENSIANDKVGDSLSENWNLDNPKRKEQLYTTFKMTQDQIQRYEKDLQTWKESEKDDAYKLLSAGAKIKEENKILKKILNDSQYERYRKWSNDNDLRH